MEGQHWNYVANELNGIKLIKKDKKLLENKMAKAFRLASLVQNKQKQFILQDERVNVMEEKNMYSKIKRQNLSTK
jgi:hypothetical protein